MAIINFRFVICICYWQFAIENQKSEIGIGKSKSAIGKLTSFGLKEKTAVVMFPSGRLIVSIPRAEQISEMYHVPVPLHINAAIGSMVRQLNSDLLIILNFENWAISSKVRRY